MDNSNSFHARHDPPLQPPIQRPVFRPKVALNPIAEIFTPEPPPPTVVVKKKAPKEKKTPQVKSNMFDCSNRELAQRIKNGEFALAEDFGPKATMEIVDPRKKKDHVSMQALLSRKQKTPEEVRIQNERDVEYIGRMNQKWEEPFWLAAALGFERVPTTEEMVTAAPFHDQNAGLAPRPHGVIRFVDPPYEVSEADVLNTLGRLCKVAPQPPGTGFFGVHILMECDTGKTMDVYVEVESEQEAQIVYHQFQRREQDKRTTTLGRKQAKVELSSPEELMKALFPHATNVTWNGFSPIVDWSRPEYYPGVPSLGFNGFLGDEQSNLLIKWLLAPERSPFANKHQNRPYEQVVTILHKYPVHAPHTILLKDRVRVYNIAKAALSTLAASLRRPTEKTQDLLSPKLLQKIVVAALSVSLFTDAQKFELVKIVRSFGFDHMLDSHGMQVRLGGLRKACGMSPFLAVVWMPGVTDALIDFYCKILQRYSQQLDTSALTEGEIMACKRIREVTDDHPLVAVRINYGVPDELLPSMTLATTAAIETAWLAKALESVRAEFDAICSRP